MRVNPSRHVHALREVSQYNQPKHARAVSIGPGFLESGSFMVGGSGGSVCGMGTLSVTDQAGRGNARRGVTQVIRRLRHDQLLSCLTCFVLAGQLPLMDTSYRRCTYENMSPSTRKPQQTWAILIAGQSAAAAAPIFDHVHRRFW
jgi:hypothetical protein